MHYHNKKEEWMALTSGMLKIVLEDIETKERQVKILDEDSDDYSMLYILAEVAHVIKNVGVKNSSVVVFSTTSQIPGDTIEYAMEV